MTKNIVLVSILISVNESKHIWLQAREEKSGESKREFPGGKIEKEEYPEQAVVREVKEEVGITIDTKNIQFFKKYEFEYTEVIVHLFSFLYQDEMGVFPPEGYKSLDLMLNDERDLNYGQNVKILEDLRSYFQ